MFPVATDWDHCLARYLPDGSRDATFDGPSGTGDGEFVYSMGAYYDQPTELIGAADGRLVVAGECANATNADFCLVRFDQAGAFPDYDDAGGADWAAAGASGFFGACLRAVSGGAAATWAANDPCDQTDAAYWNDIPATSEQVATTSALEPDPVDATAHLRFGLYTASSQPAGDYIAPITFTVLAPSA